MSGVMIMSPMSAIELPDATSWGGALLVSDLGVILAEGPDAGSFLHGQVSQDMEGQLADEARLAAYCSAKGRMQASLLTLRPQPERFWLVTDRGVLPGLLKRLSMFVMRAKAKLSDASETVCVIGLVGQVAADALGAVAPEAAWQAAAHADGLLIRLPDVLGARRWYWIGPRQQADSVKAALPALTTQQWAWLDVMSGIPRIEPATVEQFVPQMINFELIGGVNFRKGCYPGQEVVARSQYRGTTKRRAFVLHADQALRPGQEIFGEADPGQPAGMVINAAPRPGSVSGYSALAEVKLSAIDTGLGAGDGVKLTLAEQPYALPSADEAA
jgi:folate-binding protein YgfZ